MSWGIAPLEGDRAKVVGVAPPHAEPGSVSKARPMATPSIRSITTALIVSMAAITPMDVASGLLEESVFLVFDYFSGLYFGYFFRQGELPREGCCLLRLLVRRQAVYISI